LDEGRREVLHKTAPGVALVEGAAPDAARVGLVVLAVANSAIGEAAALCEKWGIPAHVPVVHCSGRAPATGFAAKGRPQGAAHPAVSFPAPGLAQKEGACFLVCGDDPAVAAMDEVLAASGIRAVKAFPGDRGLYYAGCIAAANFMALSGLLGDTLLRKSGLNPEEARAILTSVMSSVLQNADLVGFRDALTGPAVRGEADLVIEEVDAVMKNALELLPFFLEANRSLAQVAGRKEVVAAIVQWATRRAGPKRTA